MWVNCLEYDAKVNPERYLANTFYMNGVFERIGHKLFQPLSLLISIVPHCIMIDSTSLVRFSAPQGTNSALLKCVTENEVPFWNTLFNMGKRVFPQKR